MPRILVIDDDAEIRALLRQMLERSGYEVMDAPDGVEGIRLYREKPADLVITDIGMPDISGKDVARIIKKANPETKVVLCSGWGVQLDETEMKQLGVEVVITKPFDRENIIATINRILGAEKKPQDVRPKRIPLE